MKYKIKKSPVENTEPVETKEPVESLEPVMITRPCDCGDPNCDKILFAILRPQIKRLADTGETVYAAYMPADVARGMVAWLEDRLGMQKDDVIQ